MAKVLACPACGNKHPLELLSGLESFLCKQCGKKLAVPSEAISACCPNQMRESNGVSSREPISDLEKTNVKPGPKVEGKDSLEAGEIQIVARSCIPSDPSGDFEGVSSANAQEIVANSTSIQNQNIVDEKTLPDSNRLSSADERKRFIPSSFQSGKIGNWFKGIADLQKIHIPILGQSLSWLLAVPAGFFIVVLLPRFFGYGFHASDFVGVITHQGIGRYKIVVALIFLWSATTAICVSLFNSIIRKLFLAKKLAT